MYNYKKLLMDILANGEESKDRTGTGTIKVFGRQLRFNLKEGFPMVTGKRVPFKAVYGELLWFISGSTNVKWLQDNGITIWDEWADENGDLGPVYGKQWRDWNGVDQLQKAIDTIKNNPDSRRIIVNAWNVSQIPEMALPPCHMFYQFQVSQKGLSCLIYQRSVDSFLGLPFNIASYAILTHMVAHVCNLPVNELIWVGGDTHIYSNHVNQVKQYINLPTYPLPGLLFDHEYKNIDDFTLDSIELVNYYHGPTIKAEVAV